MKKKSLVFRLALAVMVVCFVISILITGCQQSSTTSPSASTSVTPTTSASTPTTKTSTSTTPAVTTPQPQYGGTLRISEQSGITSFGFPAKINGTHSQRIAAPAVERLFIMDKGGKPSPWLATGYQSDMAAKTYTIALRQGVKFHDGTDFNADAVKWNLDQCMATKTSGTANYKSIEVVDTYTVRINLNSWDSSVVDYLTYYAGMIISPTAYKTNGEEWCASHPVGTGPFVFVSGERDVKYVYKKNDNYWIKGKPYLDGIEFTIVADAITRDINFRAKEQDVTTTIDPKVAAGLKKDNYSMNVQSFTLGSNGVVFDSKTTTSPFANLKVRQAVAYAIDVQQLNEAVYYGMTEISNQPCSKSSWAYNPAVVGYAYDLNKAKALMAEAGYATGFKTKINYVGDASVTQWYTGVASLLKAINIDAELAAGTAPKIIQMNSSGWEGMMMISITPEPDAAAYLYNKFGGGPSTMGSIIVPDDLKTTALNAVTALDFAAKQKDAQQFMKMLIDTYCLRTSWTITRVYAAWYPYVNGTGLAQTPDITNWTPQDAWVAKH